MFSRMILEQWAQYDAKGVMSLHLIFFIMSSLLYFQFFCQLSTTCQIWQLLINSDLLTHALFLLTLSGHVLINFLLMFKLQKWQYLKLQKKFKLQK